jgi:hypothetical protein
MFLFFANIQLSSQTSSDVAHSANHNTGTHIRRASTVHIQKLSLVKLINPEESLIIFSIHSGFHHVKITVSQAKAFNSFSSGPEPITIKGNFNLLKRLIIVPVSLTKFTSLPTYTK